jgi:hypothetical protein
MGETWRAQPVTRRAERLFGTAGFAVPGIPQISRADIEGPGKAALSTFEITAVRLKVEQNQLVADIA